MFRKLKYLRPAKDAAEISRRKFMSIPVRKDEIAIDCGANVGLFTRVLSTKGAKVYAFEPNPYAFRELQRSFADNDNVVCFEKGVFTRNGTTRFFLHENSDSDPVKWSTGSSMIESKKNVSCEGSIEVDLIDLAEFVLSLNKRVKVLKMDVEGVEYTILEHLIKTGAIECIDYLFVETHEHNIPEIADDAKRVKEEIEKRNLQNIDLEWR